MVAVGRGLDVGSGPERVDLEALALGIGDEDLLLVLDTCEHLAESVGDLVEQLLNRCPLLTVLATSRMPLGVPGERLWPVPPLATPDDPADVPERGRWDAVELFWQRAHAVRPDLAVDAASAARVAEICRRLDGNPLAIELCAARTQVLGLAEIEAALDDAGALLVSRSRSGPGRQQTMDATLDWSHRLLSQSQARLFRRLAVFRGGASFDSVMAVAEEPARVGPVLDVLSALVERSLVRLGSAGPARYELPDPVRQYAERKLIESGEEAAVRGAHLRHFRALATQAAASADQSVDSALYARLESDLPNVRAALDWSRLDEQVELELGFALDLAPFAITRGHHREGRSWLDRALARADQNSGIDPRMRVRATRQAGVFAFLQCDYPAAVELLEACRVRFAELGDRAGVAAVLRTLAGIAREQGGYARAEELLAEALEIGYSLADETMIGLTRTQIAFTALLQGDHHAAQVDAADALRTAQRVGQPSDVVGALIVLGGAYLAAHNLGAARGCLQDALARSEADQLSESIAYAQQGLAMVALGHASLPEAADLLAASLRRQYELGDRWRTASVLVTVATCERMRGHPLRAARMLGAGEALLEQIGAVLPPVEEEARNYTISALAGVLSRHELDIAWMTGRSEPLATSVAAALGSLDSGPTTGVPSTTDLPSGVPTTIELTDRAPTDRPAPPLVTPVPEVPEPGVAVVTVEPAGLVEADRPVPLEIRVLGAEQVSRDGRPLAPGAFSYAKPRELLFLLAEVESLDKAEIGLALWSEASPAELRNAFHTTLHHLRRAVGADRVSYAGGRYRLRRDGVRYDVAAFTEALAAARAATSRTAEIELLQKAIGSYTGDYLPALDSGWVERRRAELKTRYCRALLALGRLLRTSGRHAAAIDAFTRVIAADPLSESGHRELMRSLAASGEPAKALRQFELLEGMLRSELDAGPSDSTVELRSRIRAGQPV